MIATILAAAPAGAAMSSTPFVAIFTVFVLAIFVGYYVVWGVTPALHTPFNGCNQRFIKYCYCRCNATDRHY